MADASVDLPDAMEAAELSVSSATVAVTEGGAAGTFEVTLTNPPGGSLDVTIASADTGAVTVSPTTLSFTDANFDTAQTVTVTPVDDDDAGDESVDITVSATGLTSETVAVTVTDDDSQGISVNMATVTVVEEATGSTVGVTLDAQPTSDVVVTVASDDTGAATATPATLTFTSANWDTAQDVTITGVSDPDTAAESVTVTLSATGLTDATVAVTVTDDDTLNISATPGTVTLTEGGSASTVSVVLTQQPAGTVTVNVTNPDSGAVTTSATSFTFNNTTWDTPQTLTLTPADDDDATDESVTVTLAATGLTSQQIAVSVTDDETQGIVLSTNTLAIAEGGSGQFSVSLAANPLASVSVNLAIAPGASASLSTGTLTFNAGNWDTPVAVTVSGTEDDDLAAGAEVVTVSSTGLTDGTVNVTVSDNDTQAIQVSTNTVPVTEGSSASFTVRLAYQPAGNVTVDLASLNTGVATVTPMSMTFSDTTWNMPQSAMVAGVDDADLVSENTTIEVTSTGLTDVDVTVNVTDDDAQAIVVSPTLASMTEGGATQTVNVRLQFDPGGPVTVNIASEDEGAVTVSAATLSFTGGAGGTWSATQPVVLTAVEDPNTDDENVDVNFTATGISPTAFPVSVTDDDSQAIILTTTSLSVQEEGATAQFGVHLAFDPVSPVTVTINSSDNGAASVSTNSIGFNTGDYQTDKFITVAGVSDPDLVDEAVTITVATGTAPDATIAVTVTEDDLQSLIVDYVAGKGGFEVTEDTGPNTFSVYLEFQPPTTVGVNVGTEPDATPPPGAGADVSASSLLFTTTNYDTPQVVTVTGTTDSDMHDESDTIDVTSPGLTGTTFGVIVFDDDVQRIVVSPSTAVTVNEGGTSDVDISLAFEPLCVRATPMCTETITLTSSDTDAATASTGLLTYGGSDWGDPQTVTIAGIEDADINNETETVTLDYSVGTGADNALDVDVLDNDTQNFDFDPMSVAALTEEGASGTIGVRLTQDPAGTAVVDIDSSDATSVTVAGGASTSLTFDSGDYTVYKYVTLQAIADVDLVGEVVDITFSTADVDVDVDRTINVTDNDEQGIQIHDAAAAGNAVSALDVDEEDTTNFYVSLAYQPTNPITVNVNLAGGEDKIAVSTATLDFTSANYATRQLVTVSGLDDSPEDLDDHAGRVITLTTAPAVSPAVTEGASATMTMTVLDTDAQEILVSLDPEDFDLSIQEGGPVDDFFVALAYPPRGGSTDSVQVDSPDPSELLVNGGGSDTLNFGSGDWSDPQRVEVQALDDYDDPEDPDSETDDDHLVNLDMPSESSGASQPTVADVDVNVHVVDDERLIIEDVTLTAYDGATRHTKRQNVNWLETVVGVTAFDQATSDVVIMTGDRDDLAAFSTAATLQVADATGVSAPVQAIEFDGTDIGVFASDGSLNIAYSSYTRDLQTELTAPVSVAPAGAIDFWPAWDGDEYGLIYRDSTDNNLLFRTVQQDGTASASTIVTTTTASFHQHPNLHPRADGGWVVYYTTSTAVRCVRLLSSGSPIPGSDVALPGLPAGAFVSSVANPFTGTTILAYNHPTNGLSAAEVNPELCEVLGVRSTNFSGGQILNTPFIAFNGLEYKVAYDLTNGTMGVTTLDENGQFRDDVNVGTGSRPSIAWVGDRWVLRAQGSIVLKSGSFQTHCNDGVENIDETGVDCGGNDCVPCVFEFTHTTGGADMDEDALYNFMLSVQGLVTDSDAIQLSITGAGISTLRGGTTRQIEGWCAAGNANWYVETYIDAYLDGGGTCDFAPPVDMYNLCPGQTEWTPLGTQSEDSCYNGQWFGQFATWGGSAGTPLGINPGYSGACQLEDNWNGVCGGTLTLRIGAGGSSTIDEVCTSATGFSNSSTCELNP